ncbi:MAG: DUF1501 domain-containing protein, partial [Planctomycetaceae bacterium]|nr:DUF1501 domain-containing protein [Planctomycetaceae bacterium]
MNNGNSMQRRTFLRSSGTSTAAAMAAGAALNSGIANQTVAALSHSAAMAGRAKSCIFVWLGGGACHIDTWDPKVVGDPTQGKKKPGSAYPAIDTAIPGVQVCEHLPRMAQRLDRGCLIRSVHHDVIDEHAAAVNRLHVGRPPTGTTVYPSLGSVVSHEV